MTKTLIFTSIFVYLFESLLFWYYCQTAFKSKYNKGLNYAIIFAAMAVCCVIQVIFTARGWSYVTVVNTITNTACFALIIYFLYGQKLLNAIVHSVVYFALVAAGEYVVIPFMSLIFGGTLATLYENNAFYFFMAVSSKFAHLVLTLLALKIYLTFFVKGGEGVKNKEKIKGLLFAFLIPLSCLMMFLVTELLYARFPLGTKEAILLTANAFLLMLVTFAAFYLHSNTVEQAQKISRFTIEQKQREFDAQYHELMNKTGEDMQILSHDFKNHLIQLDNAANMEQVHDYVARLYPSIRNFDAATVSDNATLNVIISKYNTLCTVKGVAFRFHIESALEHLEASDLSAILNNLLDNALEAAEGSEAKCIDLRLFNKNEKLETVVLTNSCDTAPIERGGELLSSKSEPDTHTHTHTHTHTAPVHGLGLKSVKKTVKKYSGFYEWEYDEQKKEFTTIISFYG